MSNLIASRIADFLKLYPPFDGMQVIDVEKLSLESVVKYFNSGEYIFHQGDAKSELLYIVKEGEVHLELEESGQLRLVDICDEGDLFGVRAMLTGKPYVFHARCDNECLVYGIPIALFKPLLKQYSGVALFFASGLAGGQSFTSNLSSSGNSLHLQDSGSLLNWNRPLVPPERSLIAASPADSIQQVAQLMNDQKVGSVVICQDGEIMGIVTDTDFRSKVGTGIADVTGDVESIMTKHVITMPLGLPLSSYLLQMLKSKIRHICITRDGYPIGMLSERDLMAAQQNHPIALAYAMEGASSVRELVELRNRAEGLIQFYLEQNVSMALTASLTSHMNDVLIQRAIVLALAELKDDFGEPPATFCWLSLGSEGREEQLIRTDQDNAILFADVEQPKMESVQRYFLKLAGRVTQILEEAGFQSCPADMMASNPKWCQPLKVWKSYFLGWIKQPEEKSLMLSTIFFDYRSIYGEEKLIKALESHVLKTIEGERIFLNFLAKNAMKNPAPLGFFKNIMVERSGEHKNEFDIKARAMMPFVDIARVLTLDHGHLGEMNTIKRYQWLAQTEPKQKDLYEQAAEAYEYLMRFRAQHGFRHGNSGRYIAIHELNKLDRQILRNTFEPIDRLQKMLETRYQLSYFQ